MTTAETFNGRCSEELRSKDGDRQELWTDNMKETPRTSQTPKRETSLVGGGHHVTWLNVPLTISNGEMNNTKTAESCGSQPLCLEPTERTPRANTTI